MDGEKINSTELMKIVFSHFGLNLDRLKEERKEFDFLIYETRKAKEATGNMAGFGLSESQRVIIDYDKDYDKFLVRREIRK